MSENMNPSSSLQNNPFVITRVVNAPRDLVWRVFTEPEHLKQWFGPQGFTLPTCNLDLQPGGVFHYSMRSPDGFEMWGKWIFREIVAPERLVVIVSFSDPQGGVARHPMAPLWPLETLSTTTFTEHEGKTIITLRWSAHNPTALEQQTFNAGHAGMQMGWSGTFTQLDAYLEKISTTA